MKTDRDMLELADKAAGFPVTFHDEYGGSTEVNGWWPCGYDDSGDVKNWWNPLTDDGDALRLAVAIAPLVPDALFDITIAFQNGIVKVGHWTNVAPRHQEVFSQDPLSATRRAIVKAAAGIGRSVIETDGVKS